LNGKSVKYGECSAITHWYIPPNTFKPEVCDDNCKECVDTAVKCYECYEEKNHVLSLEAPKMNVCVCKPEFYEPKEKNTCAACDPECYTCIEAGKCIKCKGTYTKVDENGKCLCLENYEKETDAADEINCKRPL